MKFRGPLNAVPPGWLDGAMRRLVATALPLAAALLLAGCSGADEAPTGEAAPTVEATAEAASATTTQWASMIAGAKPDVLAAQQAYEDAGCLPSDVDVICSANLMTMSTYASVVVNLVEAGTKDGAPGYIGEPPAEITKLVDETLTNAQEAVTKGEAATSGCTEQPCEGAAFQFTVAFDRLVSSLNSWAPYGA